MEDDLDFQPTAKGRSAKQGRRARAAAVEEDDKVEEDLPPSQPQPKQSGPPERPAKVVSGWGEEAPRKSRSRQLGEGFEPFEDDLFDSDRDGQFGERLRPRSPEDDDSDQDIPVIPELEEQQEEDMSTKVAVAPNVAVNRVATYRELDNDLLRQLPFLTESDIDLKLLTKALSPEQDLVEEDKPWDWDRLFTEVTSELITDMEQDEQKETDTVNEVI